MFFKALSPFIETNSLMLFKKFNIILVIDFETVQEGALYINFSKAFNKVNIDLTKRKLVSKHTYFLINKEN